MAYQERFSYLLKETFIINYEQIACICLTPNKKFLFVGSDKQIFMWNLFLNTCSRISENHSSIIRSLKCSSDGSLLISCSEYNKILIYNILTNTTYSIPSQHWLIVRDIAITSDNKYLVSVGDDHNVIIHDLLSQTHKILKDHNLAVTTVFISHNNTFFVTGSDDTTIKIWNFKKCLYTLSLTNEWIINLFISFDDKYIVIADRKNILWKIDILAKQTSACSSQFLYSFTSVVIDENSNYIVAGCKNNCTRVFDYENLSCLFIISGFANFVSDVCISNNIVYSGSWDGTINVYDLTEKKHLYWIGGHYLKCNSVFVDKERNRVFTSGDDKTVRIWNLCNGYQEEIIRVHSLPVTLVVCSENKIATIDKKKVYILDYDTRKIIYKIMIKNIASLSFNKNLNLICATVSDKNYYYCWDVDTGNNLQKSRKKFILLLLVNSKIKLK